MSTMRYEILTRFRDEDDHTGAAYWQQRWVSLGELTALLDEEQAKQIEETIDATSE